MSGRLFCIIVTFRRPDEVRETISAVLSQSRVPSTLIIVDNDPSAILQGDVEGSGHLYIGVASNVGPAGGISRGMERVLGLADDDDLLLLVDDDNPPEVSDLVDRLVRCLEAADPTVAGVGAMGARYDRRLGRLRRIDDLELEGGTVDVDYLGGNQLPVYRVKAVRDVGTFNEPMFFGYEELEYGLRLRAGGWRLLVLGQMGLELRRKYHRLDTPARSNRIVPRTPWRAYYGARNMIVIARRFGRPGATVARFIHALAVQPVHWLTTGRAEEALLSARGAVDGLRGHMGRVVDP